MTGSGRALAEAYYHEVVAPLIATRWPNVRHAAARLGSGSDVLGLDDEMSRDHDWGLRLTLLVEHERDIADIDRELERSLPPSFRGQPTRFATTWHPEAHHQIEVATADSFTMSRLGLDLRGADLRRPLSNSAWLSLTGQSVLEVTAGSVFVDDVGRLTEIREALSWYPRDIWLYVVAADWSRIGQELPFVGRAGQRDDDLGSRVITARLVRIAMHLGFLLERRWAPYSKWLGTQFSRLPAAGVAAGSLTDALTAVDWHAREAALGDALEALNKLQRSIGLPTVDTITDPFYDRPFRGLSSAPELLMDSIEDADVRRLPPGVGSIEQWADNVDVLTSAQLRAAFTRCLEEQTVRCLPDQ